MLHKVLILFHLIGFAAFVGAAFAQQRLMARSTRQSMAGPARDELERLAAAIVTLIELPALVVQIVTGILLLAGNPEWLTHGWMHGKLTCVAALLVLSHLEMWNARKIVRARAAAGETQNQGITVRKERHRVFGAVGTVAVAALILLVAYGTG